MAASENMDNDLKIIEKKLAIFLGIFRNKLQ